MSGVIGIVCGSWPPIKCGIGDFSHRLALEMSHQGREFLVITDREASGESPSGVTVLPVVKSWQPIALFTILDTLRHSGVSVVNLHYPTQRYGRVSAVDPLPAAVRLSLQIPVVTTIHEFTTYRLLGRLRVQSLVRTSTAVIVPFLDNLKALAAAMPSVATRLYHVPLGPPIEPKLPADFNRDAWRVAHRIDTDTLILVYFGFISPSKGTDVLLKAVNQLPGDCNVHLWLLADREPSDPNYAVYHSAIAAQLAQSPLANRVTWTGYLTADRVSLYLTTADLAVLPYTDGASLRRTTLLTALAHGLPVLSTGVQAPCPGVHVTPIGSVAALSKAIAHLAQDRQALASLAMKSRETAASMSWSMIASQTAAILDVAVRNGRSKTSRVP